MPKLDISLEKAKGPHPLASHINQLLDTPELRRARVFADILDGFHLKNTVTTKVEGRKATIDGQDVVNFGSANYLGLEMHPKVLEAARQALTEWGNHSGCSRIFSSHENIVRLEERLASLVGAEASLICANTSATHQGVVPSLFGQKGVTIFIDRYAHTSMHQAAMIAVAKGAQTGRVDVRYLNELEAKLEACDSKIKVVMIDGVYSMQGTMPDIPRIQEICDAHGAILYIDDAHGIAIYGERGGGVAEHFDLSYDNMILVAGLQKGLGAYGGFVAARKSVIDFLRCTSRAYIFSGTLQPQAVEGSLAAIEVCESDEGRALRARLKEISMRVRERLQAMGYVVRDGDSPIVSVLIGPELKTLLAGRRLFDVGVYVNSVLYPATPKNEGLLRISLNAVHSDAEIETLLTAFGDLKEYLAQYRRPLGPNLDYAKEIVSRQAVRRTARVTSRVSSWMKHLGIR